MQREWKALRSGSGEPPFSKFNYEDWALLSFRIEIHLLMHAFEKGLGVPGQPNLTQGHLESYYGAHFKLVRL